MYIYYIYTHKDIHYRYIDMCVCEHMSLKHRFFLLGPCHAPRGFGSRHGGSLGAGECWGMLWLKKSAWKIVGNP